MVLAALIFSDVFSRRISRTVDADGDGPQAAETTYTVYEGEHAWADYDAAGNVLARYLFGDRIDEIIARFRPGEGTAWYLTDHLGTVRDLADATGAILNTITYDSFGNVVAETNAAAGDRFKFTGREWDAEAGLYYHRCSASIANYRRARTVWEITSHTRIGPLALGMTADQVVAVLGEEYDTFERTQDAEETIYAFDRNGVHLTCTPTGGVKIISVFRPNEVAYRRVQLLGRPTEEVVNELNANGATAAMEDAGYWVGQAGVLMVEVDGVVDGVELYPE